MRPEALRRDLAAIVGEEAVTDRLFERRLYDHDIAPLPAEVSLIFKTLPDLVVKPERAEDVPRILRYASANRVPITPRGASSWGYGGTIPTRGGIVLDLTRLKKVAIEDEGMTATVEAGVSWKHLMDLLEARGLAVGVYPSSAPSATVGGWIATGGLGIGSLKYGHLREHVQRIRAVTPTGDEVYLSRGERAGPATFEAFFGSEGTLGVITEATIRVRRAPEKVAALLVSFDGMGALAEVMREVSVREVRPFFVEFVDRGYLEIRRSLDPSAPEPAEAHALFILDGPGAQVDEEEARLGELAAAAGGTLLPRELALEAWGERFYPLRIRRAGPTLLAGEVTVPLSGLLRAVEETRRIRERHRLRMGTKGFMVSPDTILLMPMYLADERERRRFMSLLPVVNEITSVGLRAGGGPYGFGIWNAFYMKETLGEEGAREIREMKRRLDPNDIMNPGKRYGVVTRFGLPLGGGAYRAGTRLLGLLGRV